MLKFKNKYTKRLLKVIPEGVMRTFHTFGLDILVLGDYIIEKNKENKL
jgi:hypothetical protein